MFKTLLSHRWYIFHMLHLYALSIPSPPHRWMSAGEQSSVSCCLCALFMLAKVTKGRLFNVHSWHFKYLQVRKYSFSRLLDTWMIHNVKQSCLLFFLNWIDIYSLLALALSGKENLTHLMSYTWSDLMVGKILFSFSSLSFPVLKLLPLLSFYHRNVWKSIDLEL